MKNEASPLKRPEERRDLRTRPGRRLSRRFLDGAARAAMATATVLIITVLGLILFYIVREGLGYLTPALILGSGEESGIWPMAVTSFYVVVSSLAIALPIGVLTAIFFTEYAGDSPLVRLLHLAVETLAGIPSIIYGLFGLLAFCRGLGLGQSILAGALTLAIMILPVIIRTTEEALKTVPISFREGSLALGTTKFQTIRHVVLPAALPGIVASCILAIGRAVGESAPVLLTVGIAKNLPKSLLDSGRTLTIHLYYLTKEAIRPEDFGIAFATATVLVLFVVILNGAVRIIVGRFERRLGGKI